MSPRSIGLNWRTERGVRIGASGFLAQLVRASGLKSDVIGSSVKKSIVGSVLSIKIIPNKLCVKI